MSTQETTLLIVGAGPTGLSAAISLLKNDFKDFIIVDQAPVRDEATRAMTVHAATMEALDSVGCADVLAKNGIPGRNMEFCDRRNKLSVADFSCLSGYTKYPYVLLLSQKKTEDYLEEHLQTLGMKVQRGKKVVGLKTRDDGCYEATFDSSETIVSKHILATDGARSVVRQMAGIDFTDPDGDAPDERLRQMILADVAFSADSPILPKEGVMGTGSGGSVFLLIPLPYDPQSSERTYRIGFNVTSEESLHDPPIEYLQRYLNQSGPIPLSSDPSVNPNPIHISKKLWATRFRTHSALASTFMKQSDAEHSNFIFLLGDAAHIHSPAGGLGMNLGIREAIGFGPFLASYLNSRDVDETSKALEALSGYISGRREKALWEIRLTKKLMNAMSTLISKPTFQYWVLRFLVFLPFFRNKVAWVLSGLGDP